MKKVIITLSLIITLASIRVNASVAADYSSFDSANISVGQDERVSGKGTMILKGDIWVIRMEDKNGIADYVPLNLQKEFQATKMLVKFAGTTREVFDTEKLAGIQITFIKITTIR